MLVSIRDGLVGWMCALTLLACGDDGSAAMDDAGAIDAIDAIATIDAPVPDGPIDALLFDAMPVEPGANCTHPIVLTPGDSSGGNTALMDANGRGSCSPSTNGSRDAIFRFEVGDTPKDLLVNVSVDEGVAQPFDVVLYARTQCNSSASEIACVDSGWGESAQFLDVSGPLFVFVDGSVQFGGANSGAFTLTSSAREIVNLGDTCDPAGMTSRCSTGNRCMAGVCVEDSAALACSSATDISLALAMTGSFATTATTQPFAADFYAGSCPADPLLASPEHIYRFVVEAPSSFTATTDLPGTNFDTYLYLRQGSPGSCDGTEVACHDDVDLPAQNLRSTISVPTLPIGTYYLFVDGSSPGQNSGQYELNATLSVN